MDLRCELGQRASCGVDVGRLRRRWSGQRPEGRFKGRVIRFAVRCRARSIGDRCLRDGNVGWSLHERLHGRVCRGRNHAGHGCPGLPRIANLHDRGLCNGHDRLRAQVLRRLCGAGVSRRILSLRLLPLDLCVERVHAGHPLGEHGRFARQQRTDLVHVFGVQRSGRGVLFGLGRVLKLVCGSEGRESTVELLYRRHLVDVFEVARMAFVQPIFRRRRLGEQRPFLLQRGRHVRAASGVSFRGAGRDGLSRNRRVGLGGRLRGSCRWRRGFFGRCTVLRVQVEAGRFRRQQDERTHTGAVPAGLEDVHVPAISPHHRVQVSRVQLRLTALGCGPIERLDQ